MKRLNLLLSALILACVVVLGGWFTGYAATDTSAGPRASGLAPALQQNATPAPVGGTATPLSEIAVTGTGKVSIKPDTALVSIGAESTLPGLAGASADVAKRMAAVLDKVRSLGVDDKDITTVNYSVFPETSQPKSGEVSRITGYHVSNVVRVKVRKLENVGPIVDGAVTAGANSIGGLTFTVDDPSKPEAEARALAVKDAMGKARQLADAAGVKVGDILIISEGSAVRLPQPRVFSAGAAASATGIGPVEAGQTDITVNVEMSFAIAH